MNQAIIDNSLLAFALISAMAVTKSLKRRKTGFLFSTLLLFPPLLVFLNMWGHTVAVTVVNIRRFQAGAFQYSFTVYSHFLFGIAFGVLGGLLIHCSRKYLSGYIAQKRILWWLNLVMALLFAPVGPLNPIGFLPVLAALFSSLVLLYNPYRKVLAINEAESQFDVLRKRQPARL